MTTITTTGNQITGEVFRKKKSKIEFVDTYVLYILLPTVTNLINLFSVYLLLQFAMFPIFACASH